MWGTNSREVFVVAFFSLFGGTNAQNRDVSRTLLKHTVPKDDKQNRSSDEGSNCPTSSNNTEGSTPQTHTAFTVRATVWGKRETSASGSKSRGGLRCTLSMTPVGRLREAAARRTAPTDSRLKEPLAMSTASPLPAASRVGTACRSAPLLQATLHLLPRSLMWRREESRLQLVVVAAEGDLETMRDACTPLGFLGS